MKDLFENIETERLILRKINDDDAYMLYQNIYNNFEWYKLYYQLPFESFDEYKELVSKYKEWYSNGNHFRWGIVRKSDNNMVGLVQLHSKDSLNNSCKVGYIVGYNYTNNGYMREALKEVLEFAVNKLGYHRIEADIVTDNTASLKLAESVGMTYESTKKESYKLEDKYYDQKVYVLLKKNK